jgi:hypothetical protein
MIRSGSGSCEKRMEPLASVSDGELPDLFYNYQLLKKDSAPWSQSAYFHVYKMNA